MCITTLTWKGTFYLRFLVCVTSPNTWHKKGISVVTGGDVELPPPERVESEGSNYLPFRSKRGEWRSIQWHRGTGYTWFLLLRFPGGPLTLPQIQVKHYFRITKLYETDITVPVLSYWTFFKYTKFKRLSSVVRLSLRNFRLKTWIPHQTSEFHHPISVVLSVSWGSMFVVYHL